MKILLASASLDDIRWATSADLVDAIAIHIEVVDVATEFRRADGA